MSTIYCTDCPAKLTYEAVKPTKCPKCGVVFANAFKGAVASTSPSARAVVDEIIDEPRPRYPKSQSSTVAKPRFRNGEWVAPIMGRMNDETPPPVTEQRGPHDDEDDDEDEYIDPRAKRRLKQELIATLNPDDIHVNDEDERPPTFADLYNAADARKAREGGGQ